jgi:UvrD-like helicase C-terminal domain/UvrD/REP helicase N-terminal domain
MIRSHSARPLNLRVIRRLPCLSEQEFDWIRSALPVGDRQGYLALDRAGRRTRLQHEWRVRLLHGLDRWEQKMRDVGVIDYLGLTAALTRHLSSLEPEYDHILVDEAQDFGTSELKILRSLCRPGPNDLFLCGDIAQHVLPKHRLLAEADISTSGRTCRIVRNYRNTREILEAAYAVLMENLDEHLLDSADLEILDPKCASRSSSEPIVLEADSLETEIGYARSLANDHLLANPHHRCCIALAGYTIREVDTLAQRLSMPVLRGERGPMNESLVLSDLEQTKGYEFNLVIILNCREGVLPPEGTAPEESFRHGCRLYVAMTRARDELVLSYHDTATAWLTKTRKLLTFMRWEEVVTLDHSLIAAPPERLREAEPDDSDALKLSGRQFLYTPHARGLSLEAIRKIDELVDGVGLIRNQTRVKWRNMATLLEDLEKPGRTQLIFGPVVQKEVREKLKPLLASRRLPDGEARTSPS